MKILLAFGALTATCCLIHAAPELAIYEIQGAGHQSPHSGSRVSTTGYVTHVTSDGFYLQDGTGDGEVATSDGIFVFTGTKVTLKLYDFVELEGEVVEHTPGEPSAHNLSVTRLENHTLLPSVIDPPNWRPNGGIVIGAGGRLPPTVVIDDDSLQTFDPVGDGIDFYEAMEGMVVTLKAPMVVCPSNAKAEIYVVVDEGTGASGMSVRGTLNLGPNDYNPERIQVQEEPRKLIPGPLVGEINVGDLLDDVVGVMDYDGMYEVRSSGPVTMTAGGLTPQVTSLAPHSDRLRVATYSLKGLDPHHESAPATDQTDGDPDDDVDDDLGNGHFAAIARQLVHNLRSPDVIALQDVQDNDGAEISAIISASVTLQTLVDAIGAEGGPAYQFFDTPGVVPATIDGNAIVNPSGGQPGGNRRNAILYNPARVTAQSPGVSVVWDTDLADGDAFANCARPIHMTFGFGGDSFDLIALQLNDREGGVSLFGEIQPASEMQEDPSVNAGVDLRSAQAAVVRDFVDLELGVRTHVIVMGDLNDPEFLSPALGFRGRLTNLTETLENAERYSAIAQGSSLALDHIFIDADFMQQSPRCEVVHVNCEFADTAARVSDHDPVLASLAFAHPFAFEVRTMDGYGNSLTDPLAGMAGQAYSRTTTPAFAELLNYPRGSTAAANPNPLVIMQSEPHSFINPGGFRAGKGGWGFWDRV